MKPLVTSLRLIAATANAAQPVPLQSQDVVGDWISLRGCSESVYKFTADGKYRRYRFDMIEAWTWSLRDGDKITNTHYDDPIKEMCQRNRGKR